MSKKYFKVIDDKYNSSHNDKLIGKVFSLDEVPPHVHVMVLTKKSLDSDKNRSKKNKKNESKISLMDIISDISK